MLNRVSYSVISSIVQAKELCQSTKMKASLKIDQSTYPVSQFKLCNEEISADYAIELTLCVQHPIALQQLQEYLSSYAVFHLETFGQPEAYYHGMIAQVTLDPHETTESGIHYAVSIKSPLRLLKDSNYHRTFVNQTISSIIQQVLSNYPLLKAQAHFQITHSDWQQDLITQLADESDYDFLRRICADHGIVFYCRHFADYFELWFNDQPINDRSQSLWFINSNDLAANHEKITPSIWDIQSRQIDTLPKKTQLHQTHFSRPHVDLTANHQEKNHKQENVSTSDSKNVIYGSDYIDKKQGEQLAGNYQRAHQTQAQQLTAKSNCLNLPMGSLITIEACPTLSINGTWRLIGLSQQGSDADLDHQANRGNDCSQLTMIKAEQRYQMMPQQQPKNSSNAWGNIHAMKTSASLTEQGHYYLELQEDEDKQRIGADRCGIRHLMDHHGSNHGKHLSLLTGTTVLVDFEASNANRPIILGAFPHSQQHSVVTQKNRHQHHLQTQSGHQLCLDDHSKKSKITLQTAEKQHQIQLDANEQQHRVMLKTSQGTLAETAQQNHITTTENNFIQQAKGQHQLAIEGDASQVSQKGSQHSVANKDISQRSEQNSTIISKQQLQHQIEKNHQIIAGDGISMDSQQGNLIVSADQGNLSILSDLNHWLQAGKQINIHNGQARLQIDGQGLTINGSQVEVIGKISGGEPLTNTQKAVSAQGNAQGKMNLGGQGKAAEASVLSSSPSLSVLPSLSVGDLKLKPASTVLTNLFPVLSLELSVISPVTGVIVFEDKPYIYKTTLSGSMSLQKQGTHPAGKLVLNQYKISAKNMLGDFFSGMTLRPTSHEQLMIGSKVTGEFVSDSITMVGYNLVFIASPTSIDKVFDSWKISGDIAFSATLKPQDKDHIPPIMLQKTSAKSLVKSNWKGIQLSAVISSVAIIGKELLPVVDEIALGALIVV